MHIELNKCGKKFGFQWIFRNLSFQFTTGQHWAITGHNGSGKSTFLKLISGIITPSEGVISYSLDAQPVNPENIYQFISFSGPYAEPPLNFTLTELVTFHAHAKPFLKGISVEEFIELCKLSKHANKPVQSFSSGMRQRVVLSLAILSECPVLLLDEPTSNLDDHTVNWYKNLIETYASHKLIVVCTNQPAREAAFCNQTIQLS